ncbi:sigma-70 family RNA polymerase sigma factor [Streptomyces sp. NPDC006923]|uniref:sigma-70 family RNA polymerase sigma factor n=1 Tax=Streptomyces sp. NPDC006923 TaxID=3155355 RepID=UPI0033C4C48B
MPRPASGTGGPVGGAGAAGEADGGVPPQRDGPGEPPVSRTPPSGPQKAAARPARPAGRETPSSPLPPSDAELIQRMREGDDSAYEELFRRHSDSVRRYARTCCRDAHTADDLTAEVFARTLQAVRGGAGPEHAVRAYLLTTVRRVAASWTRSAKREQLVEDFAVFAEQAARSSEVSDIDTLDLGADVRAMHEAERSMAMRAFRSLPERWQAVLWHTTVEEESPSEVAPLFGLTANATAVLAGRAREGLKQAYLQAHVSSALTSDGDCARYADRLGAYARGGLRTRAERGLRKHLAECAKCRLAVGELELVNAGIPGLVPVAVIGWFGAGYSLKAAGVVAGGVAGAAGAGVAGGASAASGASAGSAPAAGAAPVGGASGSASGGASGSASGSAAGGGSGGTAGGVVSGGIAAPVKAGVAGLVAVATATGLVWALAGDPPPAPGPQAKPPVAQPVVPRVPEPAPEPPRPRAPQPAVSPAKATPRPGRTPVPAPAPSAEQRPAPTPAEPSAPPVPGPVPRPEPSPPQSPPPSPAPPRPAPVDYRVNQLAYGVLGDGSAPEVRLAGSGWLWRRWGMSIDGTRYGHGVTMHAPSSVTIDLNRRCSTYEALVGVDDLTPGRGAVRFSVHGDGGRLWRSPVLRGGEKALPVEVGIAGQRSVRLVVEPQTPFGMTALADWAESRIRCR